jgi:hypothetical protein
MVKSISARQQRRLCCHLGIHAKQVFVISRNPEARANATYADWRIRHQINNQAKCLNGAGSPQATGLQSAARKPGSLLWIMSVDACAEGTPHLAVRVRKGLRICTVQSRKELRASALPHLKASINETFKYWGCQAWLCACGRNSAFAPLITSDNKISLSNKRTMGQRKRTPLEPMLRKSAGHKAT